MLSCVQFFVTLWTVAHQAPLSMDSLGKNTEVGCHALLQGIFPAQRSNSSVSCLLHWQASSWKHLDECHQKEAPIYRHSLLRLTVFKKDNNNIQFSSVTPHVQLFVTPWTVARQASLSITNSWSLLKLMSTESVMPSNHLILCCPLLLLPSIFLSIRVFSSESVLRIRWPEYWSFSFSISPANAYSGLITLAMINLIS